MRQIWAEKTGLSMFGKIIWQKCASYGITNMHTQTLTKARTRVCAAQMNPEELSVCVNKHCWAYTAGGSSPIIGFRWNRLVAGSESVHFHSAACLSSKSVLHTTWTHFSGLIVCFYSSSDVNVYWFICVSETEKPQQLLSHRPQSPCKPRELCVWGQGEL